MGPQNKKIEWVSDNPLIAAVDSDGNVTGMPIDISSEHTTTIHAKCDGYSADCKVRVTNEICDIEKYVTYNFYANKEQEEIIISAKNDYKHKIASYIIISYYDDIGKKVWEESVEFMIESGDTTYTTVSYPNSFAKYDYTTKELLCISTPEVIYDLGVTELKQDAFGITINIDKQDHLHAEVAFQCVFFKDSIPVKINKQVLRLDYKRPTANISFIPSYEVGYIGDDLSHYIPYDDYKITYWYSPL